MLHSIYDLLGFLAPVLIELKILIRALSDFAWDEPTIDDQLRRWKTWSAPLECLESLKIPRCFRPIYLDRKFIYELHHFAVASWLA